MRSLLFALTVIVASVSAFFGGTPVARAASTVVSLTFDDTLRDHYDTVRPLLLAHGLRATFYVNSGRIGAPNYLSLDQVRTLEREGNEIGGHTVHHVPLSTVGADEQARQICNDRANLLALGLRVVSFAYPLASEDPSIQRIALQCGYDSARTVGGLDCAGCASIETMPPREALYVRTPSSVVDSTNLALMQEYVLNAEAAGGGWLPLVFHHSCDGCSVLNVVPTQLGAFLDWLALRAERGTTVKTVAEVMGTSPQPPVRMPLPPPPALGENALSNGSFEAKNPDDSPSCWRIARGDDEVSFSASPHLGQVGVSATMKDDDASGPRLVMIEDMGECSMHATPGHLTVVSAWVRGGAPVRFLAYVRDHQGVWRYFTRSDALPSSSTWGLVRWTMDPIDDDVDGLAIGLEVAAPGTLNIDDVSLVDSGTGDDGDANRGCNLEPRRPHRFADVGALSTLVVLFAARRRFGRRRTLGRSSRGEDNYAVGSLRRPMKRTLPCLVSRMMKRKG